MTAARLRLFIALVAFFGWMALLGVTVFRHRTMPLEILSRSQLLEATHQAVVEIALQADGLPEPNVGLEQNLGERGTLPATFRIENLAAAQSSLALPLHAGKYLVLLQHSGGTTYRIAGWPRMPGIEARQPGEEYITFKKTAQVRRPVVYPWDASTQAQLRSLGYEF